VSGDVVFCGDEFLLHPSSEGNLLLDHESLLFSCLLYANNVVAFVLVTENAVDAEQVRVLFTKSFKLFTMECTLVLNNHLAKVFMVRNFRLLA
jgi:hypothetical protein